MEEPRKRTPREVMFGMYWDKEEAMPRAKVKRLTPNLVLSYFNNLSGYINGPVWHIDCITQERTLCPGRDQCAKCERNKPDAEEDRPARWAYS